MLGIQVENVLGLFCRVVKHIKKLGNEIYTDYTPLKINLVVL